jgi:hypothetical protein
MQRDTGAGHLTAKLQMGFTGPLSPENFKAIKYGQGRMRSRSRLRGDIMQNKTTGPLLWALAALVFPIVVVAPLPAHAQDQAAPPSSAAPDNSVHNKAQTKTADNQKDNASDREVTQKIRRSITADKSLSTYAHNVKIITQNGQVTLKGPVRNENEKEMIASKAAEVVGAEKVNNQLTVKQ